MAKKSKTGKLKYQLAFEYRSLKWLVLEIVLFSVFIEIAYTYFKVKNIKSNDDIAFAPVISGGLWQVLFYITMIIGFLSVAYVVFGDRKDFYGLYALRTMPIDTKYIIISKLGVSILAMLGIYGSQLLSFIFSWSLFTGKIQVARRVSHALNIALVKDAFIYSAFPYTLLGLVINIVVIIILTIGFSYLLYSVKTRITSKILLSGVFFILNLVAAVAFVAIGVRVPFIPINIEGISANTSIVVSICVVVYIGALGLIIRKMYKEFIYE